MIVEEPKNEADYLERESRVAREALVAMRGEITKSLGRTADVSAWTRRYPWASLATAAAGGLAAGVAVKSAATGKSATADAGNEQYKMNGAAHRNDSATAQASAHPAGRMVSGLGVLLSAAMSAAAVAATQAITEIVKSSVHEAMHPDEQKPPQ